MPRQKKKFTVRAVEKALKDTIDRVQKDLPKVVRIASEIDTRLTEAKKIKDGRKKISGFPGGRLEFDYYPREHNVFFWVTLQIELKRHNPAKLIVADRCFSEDTFEESFLLVKFDDCFHLEYGNESEIRAYVKKAKERLAKISVRKLAKKLASIMNEFLSYHTGP